MNIEKENQEKTQNEDKFIDFEFNKVIRNKPIKKEAIEEKKEVKKVEEKVVKTPVVKEKAKKLAPTYKYGNVVLRNLNDLQTLLLINYHNIDKIATKLLNDNEFLKWLQRNSPNEESYTEWLNNIL